MNDFQLKLILSMLAGVMFSFIFILLAFSLPPDKETYRVVTKSKVGKIAEAARNR
ncbi:hypothetical protein SAMN06313486_1082 [Epsilonproteobacteria bacterium SCGC AD-308-P11]|jgi:hypothetical protein|nr:hypothetical protein SAMN06313486_1082 [Epsilonproteobacteria bacterium SCGC AD-308-P11]